MQDFLALHYQWLRALHILSVIAWMAGLLYLPRLFVHHVGATPGGELAANLEEQEAKLLRRIMNPAMIAAFVFGGSMLWAQWPALIQQPWMHAKLTLVVLMTGAHHYYAIARKRFAKGTNRRSARFWRIANEAPFVLAIGIVIFAVVQPFQI